MVIESLPEASPDANRSWLARLGRQVSRALTKLTEGEDSRVTIATYRYIKTLPEPRRSQYLERVTRMPSRGIE